MTSKTSFPEDNGGDLGCLGGSSRSAVALPPPAGDRDPGACVHELIGPAAGSSTVDGGDDSDGRGEEQEAEEREELLLF